MRKVIVYIACSVDGFIAKPNDDLSFLSLVEQEGEDYGYSAFIETVDTVILGRKTYDWVMKQVPVFPHADKETYVVTRTERLSTGNTQFYTGNVKALVNQLKSKPGKNIFVDGGAALIHSLLKDQLIDEFYISLIPVLLGEGVRLFKNDFTEQTLELVAVKHFKKGLVQLHYKRSN
ncbi:MAG TPA: dihydrofolate reductase family protein [Flavisolibacter sp.]|nr:dihydrofolate reductase family protein [Flavisolibacter sp.]